jgi:hypothetical protein
MSQSALHPVPDDGPTDRASDHKTHFGPSEGHPRAGARLRHVHGEAAACRPAASLHRRREVLAAGQSGGSGEQREMSAKLQRAERQRLRPTTRCGPCGAGPPGWPARRGCACATGTRGFSHGDGCSAGTYVCPWSRLSFSQCSVVLGAPWAQRRDCGVRTAGSQAAPCRHGRHCCGPGSPTTQTASGRQRGHARMPAGGRGTLRA